MKKTIKIMAAVSSVMMMALSGLSQTPVMTGADSVNNEQNRNISDGSFITEGVERQIIDIRLAQMALENADRPRTKQLAREMIQNDRYILRNLLKHADEEQLPTVTRQELRLAMQQVKKDKTINLNDPEGARTSGNVVTDSLGSGSSGSGNVYGDDTGTLSRSRSSNEGANYSATGTYAYNNELYPLEFREMSNIKGKTFDERWVLAMSHRFNEKLSYFDAAIPNLKNTDLKMLATQAVPRIRISHNQLHKIRQGKAKSRGMDEGQQAVGDDKMNSGKPQRQGGQPNDR